MLEFIPEWDRIGKTLNTFTEGRLDKDTQVVPKTLLFWSLHISCVGPEKEFEF